MKTLDIEVAMMKELDIRMNIIVPNVYDGIGLTYEADLVSLNTRGYATEVEIKISRADLLKDQTKAHSHDSNLFKYFYFAIPEELLEIGLKVIPKRAGIYTVSRRQESWGMRTIVEKVRDSEINKNCVKWDLELRSKLGRLGCLRILAFKESKQREYRGEASFITDSGDRLFASDISKIYKVYTSDEHICQIKFKKGRNRYKDRFFEDLYPLSWNDAKGFCFFMTENKLKFLEKPA